MYKDTPGLLWDLYGREVVSHEYLLETNMALDAPNLTQWAMKHDFRNLLFLNTLHQLIHRNHEISRGEIETPNNVSAYTIIVSNIHN